MENYVSRLFNNDYIGAKKELDERIKSLVAEKLEILKLRVVAEMYEELVPELVTETNVMKMGRTKLVRVRVRKGKVQRRKKLSNVKGYTLRSGKMVRMSAMERRHRKMASRKSRFKRRRKLRQSIRKRKLSMRIRKRQGIGL